MHRTGIRMAASILFVLMFTLSCARQIPEKRFVNENARFDLLIGGETSDFKDDIVSRLVERYKGRGNIDIVNFTRLKQVQCGDYDVILVMDSVHAWSLFNFSLKSFLKKTQNCNNVVLLFTAGDPDWKYRYNDLDAITSASIVGDEDRIFIELSAKIDGLISKM